MKCYDPKLLVQRPDFMLEQEKSYQRPTTMETNHLPRVTPGLPNSEKSGPNRSLHQMASSSVHHGPFSRARRARKGVQETLNFLHQNRTAKAL